MCGGALAHLNTPTSHSRSVSRSVLGMGEQLSRSAARPAQLCAARPCSSWRGERSRDPATPRSLTWILLRVGSGAMESISFLLLLPPLWMYCL